MPDGRCRTGVPRMKRLALVTGLRWRTFDDDSEAVVYDPARSQTHLVDRAAIEYLCQVQPLQPVSEAELIESLLPEDDGAASQLDSQRAMAHQWLVELQRLGWLVDSPC